jgi:RNA polymerase sigma factor (sigma-70 family)
VRDSLALLLGLHGHHTQPFASAEDFLVAWRPEWRGCLLLDIRMAGMDGLALQKAMAERGIELPAIFITAHGDVAKARAALRAGAVDFLEKPLDDSLLLAAVAEALAREAGRHDAVAEAASIAERLNRLTTREREVLDLVAAGRPNREIAAALGISPRTVEVYKARMMEKMEARTLPDLMRLMLSR